MSAHDEAIATCRDLVEHGRAELADHLATALVNRGTVLEGLGQHAEAVSAHDEAIATYRDLMEHGLAELANDLATALMNRGRRLNDLGQHAEAVSAHDEAIATYRDLVEHGRAELASHLARALISWGTVRRAWAGWMRRCRPTTRRSPSGATWWSTAAPSWPTTWPWP